MNFRNLLISCLIFTPLAAIQSQGLFEAESSKEKSSISSMVNIHGYARSLVYLGMNHEDEVNLQSLYAEGAFSMDMNVGKEGKFYSEFRIRSGNEFGENISEVDLRESWVSTSFGPLNIKTGKQFMQWGMSSFINPTDQFTPLNPLVRSPEPDDRYLSIWAMNASLQLSAASSLKLLWMPLYKPSVLVTDPFNFPDYIQFSEEYIPDIRIKESGFGILYDLRSRLLDFQISYFHGFRNTPAIQSDTAVFNLATFSPERIELNQSAYKINAYGMNLTVPIGTFLFRSEASWIDLPEKSKLDSIIFPELGYCAEIEKSGESVSLVAGYYGKYILDYTPVESMPDAITSGFPDLADILPPGTIPDAGFPNSYLLKQLSGFNRLYNYQIAEFYHSCYGIAKIQLFHEKLAIEIAGMYSITDDEIALSSSIKYKIYDGLAIQLGAYFLNGPEGSLYHFIGKDLSAGYLSVKALF